MLALFAVVSTWKLEPSSGHWERKPRHRLDIWKIQMGAAWHHHLGGVDREQTSTPVPAADFVGSIPPTRETFPSTQSWFAKPTDTPSGWKSQCIYCYRWQNEIFQVFWTQNNSCGKHWISADMSLSAKWSRDGQVSLTMQWVWGFLMLVQPPPMTIDLETLSK